MTKKLISSILVAIFVLSFGSLTAFAEATDKSPHVGELKTTSTVTRPASDYKTFDFIAGENYKFTNHSKGTTYISSDNNVVSVDNDGGISAKKTGTATITVKKATGNQVYAVEVSKKDKTSSVVNLPKEKAEKIVEQLEKFANRRAEMDWSNISTGNINNVETYSVTATTSDNLVYEIEEYIDSLKRKDGDRNGLLVYAEAYSSTSGTGTYTVKVYVKLVEIDMYEKARDNK